MSLETKIEALTAVLDRIAAALDTAERTVKAEKAEPKAEKPKAEKPKAEPKAEKPKAEKPAPKAEPEPEGVTLKQLGPALVGLMKKHGQDAGIAVLKKHEVAKVSDLDPSQFAGFLADIQKAMD